jgi:hypothetical protein
MRDADLLETTIEELKGFVINKIEDCNGKYMTKFYGNARR